MMHGGAYEAGPYYAPGSRWKPGDAVIFYRDGKAESVSEYDAHRMTEEKARAALKRRRVM